MTARLDERRVLSVGLLALAAVLLAVGALPQRAPSAPDAPVAPESEAVDAHSRALAVSTRVLGGLRAGDRLGALVVEHVSEPRDGEIAVELVDDAGQGLRVWIRRRGTAPHGAHASTEDFDLSTGFPRPGRTMVTADVAQGAADALAARISEAHPEVPAELR